MAKSKKDTGKSTSVEKTEDKVVKKDDVEQTVQEVVEDSKDGTKKVTRPKSAYILFCNKYREQVKKDNQGAAPKIVLTKLGELWQEFKKEGNDEYKEFVKLAEDEKAVYNLTKDSKKVVAKKPKKKVDSEKKDDEKEKKPRAPNGYMNYLKANRELYKKEFPEYTSKQVVKGLADKWKALDSEAKTDWKNGSN